MYIFTCLNRFEDMMTCIYDAWDSGYGHKNIRLKLEPVGNLELFCNYIHVDPDPLKAKKVIRSIQSKISYAAYQMIYRAAMSFQEDKLDCIYRFMILGFATGKTVVDQLHHPLVAPLFEIDRKVMNEAHYFHEFIRFSAVGSQFLVSHIEPKCNIITLIAPHFADRMPSENWLIIDDGRKLAIVQSANQDYYLTTLNNDEFAQLQTLRNQTDDYSDLWAGFFHATSIKPRESYRRQRQMLPLWYRKNLIEFTYPHSP